MYLWGTLVLPCVTIRPLNRRRGRGEVRVRFPAGIYTRLLVRYILAPNVNRTDKSWNTSFIWLYSEKLLLRFGDESKFEGV